MLSRVAFGRLPGAVGAVAMLFLAQLAASARVTGSFQGVSLAEEVEDMDPQMLAAAMHHKRRQDEKRRQQEEERKREERRRKEEYLRRERHKAENLQDCKYKEDWALVPDSCTAKCGGGVETVELRSREVVVPQDKYGYGKECPPLCTDSDTSGCGEKQLQNCASEPCLKDCITIDLGNVVEGTGVPVAWNYTRTRETEECVFQFWMVLSKSPFQAELQAETKQMIKGDPNVYGITQHGYTGHMTLNSGNKAELVLGFRGCSLQAGADGKEPAASFDLPAGSARTCPQRQDQQKLLWKAASLNGISMDAKLSTEPAKRAFPFGVTMAPNPPPSRRLNFVREGNEVVARLRDLGLDNGAAVHSARVRLRPLFLNYYSECGWTTVPHCDSAGEASSPCMLMAFGEGGVGKLTLRGLPMARTYEALVQFESDAGLSDPRDTKFSTRTTSEKCVISHWSCGDGEDVKNVLPAGSADGCSLMGSPLPKCSVKNKFEAVSKRPKCFGKRYWQECTPVPATGSKEADCADVTAAVLGQPTAMQVCTHQNMENKERCEARGCGKSFFPWRTQSCCCSPSTGADVQEDSPGCACVVADKCESLGLVAARDPKKSCRH